MSDFTKRVVLETDEAEKDLKELSKASLEAGKSFKSLDASSRTLKRSLDEFDKVASKTSTSTFSAFKTGMKQIGDIVQPFNQGLELAGKALRFAEAGLEAYAKTSEKAAKDVNKLTSEFQYYKNVVMSGIGEVTVELGRSAVSFDQAVEALRRGGEKGFGQAYGQITKEWDALNLAIKDTAKALGGLAENEVTRFGDITSTVAKNATRAMESAVAEARKLAEEYRKIGGRLLGPGNRVESHRAGMTAAEEQEIQSANALYQVEQDEAETARRAVDFGGAFSNLSESGSALAQMQETLRQLRDDKNKSLLESAFGPIEQFDLYRNSVEQLGNAFSAFGAAVGAGYEAVVTGQGSVSAAFKKIFADSLMAMGKESAIASLRETALGFGSLALGPLGGASAAMHFKAAALHGIVAVTAGAVAHSAGTSAQVKAGEAAAAEKAKEEEKTKKEQEKKDKAAGRSGSRDGGGGDPTRPIYVILGEHFGEMSARERRARVDEQVARAIRERDE